MTIASWQQRPDSSGYVRARSADPVRASHHQPNYSSPKATRRVLLAGMKLARSLLASRPLSKYYDREEFPGPDVQSDDGAFERRQAERTTTFHLMGTCRMAPDSDPTAVVDDQLRCAGFWACAWSTPRSLPSMPSANLNASALMIAERPPTDPRQAGLGSRGAEGLRRNGQRRERARRRCRRPVGAGGL